MKTIIDKTYQAEDGKIFTDELEALQHDIKVAANKLVNPMNDIGRDEKDEIIDYLISVDFRDLIYTIAYAHDQFTSCKEAIEKARGRALDGFG